MPFIYSFTQDHSTADQRPPKVEQLFSPCSKITKTAINDITYQIPINQATVTPTMTRIEDDDLTFGLSGLNSVAEKFPRQSTCLKGDRPPPDIHPSPSPDVPAVSSTILPESPELDHYDNTIPHYRCIYQIKDSQPIRATCFHPDGEVFVVGTNSKVLKTYMYPTGEELTNFQHDHRPTEPNHAFKFKGIHRGSVYCVAFNRSGKLLASGSNDRCIHLINYNSTKNLPEGTEYELTMHNGTVRDLCFLNNDDENDSSTFLVSGGAGDNSIYLTDCNVMKPVQALQGHSSTVMSLHHWNETPTFVSGSVDGTIRFWDTRGGIRCTSIISTNQQGGDVKGNVASGSSAGVPVGVVRVEQTGKLLVSGHKDGRCMLYDIRGGRIIQLFEAHTDEIRTLNFSPKSYYLLTGGYDRKVRLIDIQGDLARKLPSVDIAVLNDKIVQTAWHPTDYNFVTTSADGLACLWALPESITCEI